MDSASGMISSPILLAPTSFARFPFVRCVISTRHGGVSGERLGLNLSFHVGDAPENVEENRRRLFRATGIDPGQIVTAGQCHSTHVSVVDAPGHIENTDGLITNHEGLWLVVSVADCVPVFLVDPVKRVVAAVHAGWRGSAGAIVQAAVSVMTTKFGCVPKDLFAYIGPSASVCCYEVGREVAEQFPPEVVRSEGSKWFLDLKRENRRQLLTAGLYGDRIETSPDCTIFGGLYHSYRRDGKRSGRMWAMIGLQPK